MSLVRVYSEKNTNFEQSDSSMRLNNTSRLHQIKESDKFIVDTRGNMRVKNILRYWYNRFRNSVNTKEQLKSFGIAPTFQADSLGSELSRHKILFSG